VVEAHHESGARHTFHPYPEMGRSTNRSVRGDCTFSLRYLTSQPSPPLNKTLLRKESRFVILSFALGSNLL
jgi:hypothetical protein